MAHRFCLDEVMLKIKEMIDDGFHYGCIEVSEGFEGDDGNEIACLCLTADDDGGIGCIDYEVLDEVPVAEIESYAFQGKKPAPHRPCV